MKLFPTKKRNAADLETYLKENKLQWLREHIETMIAGKRRRDKQQSPDILFPALDFGGALRFSIQGGPNHESQPKVHYFCLLDFALVECAIIRKDGSFAFDTISSSIFDEATIPLNIYIQYSIDKYEEPVAHSIHIDEVIDSIVIYCLGNKKILAENKKIYQVNKILSAGHSYA